MVLVEIEVRSVYNYRGSGAAIDRASGRIQEQPHVNSSFKISSSRFHQPTSFLLGTLPAGKDEWCY